MEYARIALLSIGCAIVYGVIHDQVTAHLYVEYFTIGHASLLGLTIANSIEWERYGLGISRQDRQ